MPLAYPAYTWKRPFFYVSFSEPLPTLSPHFSKALDSARQAAIEKCVKQCKGEVPKATLLPYGVLFASSNSTDAFSLARSHSLFRSYIHCEHNTCRDADRGQKKLSQLPLIGHDALPIASNIDLKNFLQDANYQGSLEKKWNAHSLLIGIQNV